MGWWFGGSVGIEQFWWRILDKNNIHSFHLCMISGNQVEAWPMYPVWPISARFMLGWFGGTWPACCPLAEHWHGQRALSNHVCAHSVIAMWHVIFLQHLVSNLGQLLFCRSITWPRCSNAYRDLWIMTILCSPVLTSKAFIIPYHHGKC